MKKIPLIGIAISFLAGVAFSQQLPSESTILLEKLTEWETEKRTQLEAEIREKKEQVATALEEHLKAETKKGKLDSALAIKQKMAELRGAPPTKDSNSAAKTEPTTPKLNIDEITPEELAGSYWEEEDTGSLYILFLDSERFKIIRPAGGERVYPIRIEGDELRFKWAADQGDNILRFNRRMNEIEWIGPGRKYRIREIPDELKGEQNAAEQPATAVESK